MTPEDEIRALKNTVDELSRLVPTAEEHAFIRNKMQEDETMALVWKLVKAHAPWVTILASMMGSAVYWFATHSISISGPK
jgi:hypothetical protein